MSLRQLPLVARLEAAIWDYHLEAMPPWKTLPVRGMRLMLVLIRDLMSGELTLRSMSLVYTTLLSLVPLLALSFSVLKAFGVHNQVEPMLRNFLAPLGEQGEEITVRIIQFIERMNVGVLGSVGLALLLYTAVSLMQKIEESFNFIWHIDQARSLGERFSRYLSVLLVGPILIFAALGITAAAMNMQIVRGVLTVEPVGRAVYVLGQIMPYLLVSAAFTFIYVFVPNARVRLLPALAGGVIGGVLWQTAGWAFALFVSGSTHYSAIYSSFAILVLFLIWVYVSWIILLFGSAVAFYLQHPEYVLARGGEPRLSNRMRERLALAVMSLIAGSYLQGLPGWTLQRLARELNVPSHALRGLLQALERGGVLVESNAEPPAFVPARDLAAISVASLLQTVRSAGEDRYLNPSTLPVAGGVAEALDRLERSLDASLQDLSVARLAADTASNQAADVSGRQVNG